MALPSFVVRLCITPVGLDLANTCNHHRMEETCHSPIVVYNAGTIGNQMIASKKQNKTSKLVGKFATLTRDLYTSSKHESR